MSSIRKMQECVDEIFAIHNQTKEMYEEADEVFKDLADHQKEFISSTEKITSELTTAASGHLDRAIHQNERAEAIYNQIVAEGDGVIRRFEEARKKLYGTEHERLEKFRKIRMKVLVSMVALGCIGMFFLGLNFYLGKQSHAKYSEIQGMPTTFEEKGEYYVKVKPGTELTWDHKGKKVTFAKMA